MYSSWLNGFVQKRRQERQPQRKSDEPDWGKMSWVQVIERHMKDDYGGKFPKTLKDWVEGQYYMGNMKTHEYKVVKRHFSKYHLWADMKAAIGKALAQRLPMRSLLYTPDTEKQG